MKTIVCLLLACLLAAPVPHVTAAAPVAPVIAGENLLARFDAQPYQVHAMAAWGDTLVLTDFNRLFVLRGGQPLVARLDALLGHAMETRSMVPLPGEEGLWLLDKNTGTLWLVEQKAGELVAGAPQTLSWDDYRFPMNDYVEVYAPAVYAVVKGRLYALEGSGRVVVFDPTTGEKRGTDLEHVQWMSACPGGKLLTLRWREDTAEGKPRAPMIGVADPATGETKDVRPLLPDDQRALPMRLAAYEPTTNTLYAQLGDTIYRYAGLEAGGAAAVPPHDDGGMGLLMAALPGDLLVFSSYRDVNVRAADPEALKNRISLNVRISDMTSQGINQAANGLRGVDVQVTEQSIDQETLAQLMITGDDTYDLYWVNLAGVDFDSLMRKGYAVDMAQSAALKENHNQLSPVVRRAMGGDDGVFALPVRAYATVYLQDAVFHERAPVDTLDDLVAFFERWPDEYAADYPDMLPVYTEMLRRRVYAMVLQGYVDGYIGSGRTLSFDTPLLRQLFTRVEGLHWTALGEGKDGEYFAPVLFDNEWMLSLSLMDGDGRDSHTYMPFLPAPEAGMEGALPLSVSAVFINPFSKKQPQAMQLAEALIRQVSPDARLMLYPQDSPPVENPFYRQNLEDMQGRVDQILFEAQQAEGKRRLELEDDARRVARYLEEMKESTRWLISAEHMAGWRALSRNAYVVTLNGERKGANAATDVLMQYADGQIDLERFIADAESRLRLIRLESE